MRVWDLNVLDILDYFLENRMSCLVKNIKKHKEKTVTKSEIKGISHITFICKNLDKTSKMFLEIFGAKEIYSSGKQTFSLSKEKFFKVGNLWIAIMKWKPIGKS